MVHITVAFYLAIKKNESMSFARKWIELEMIISQSDSEDTDLMLLFICGIYYIYMCVYVYTHMYDVKVKGILFGERKGTRGGENQRR